MAICGPSQGPAIDPRLASSQNLVDFTPAKGSVMPARRCIAVLVIACVNLCQLSFAEPWKKHAIHAGTHTTTALAGDFSGDGRPDVITNSEGRTRVFVAPDWREIILNEGKGHDFIHSEFSTSMAMVISTGSELAISRA